MALGGEGLSEFNSDPRLHSQLLEQKGFVAQILKVVQSFFDAGIVYGGKPPPEHQWL